MPPPPPPPPPFFFFFFFFFFLKFFLPSTRASRKTRDGVVVSNKMDQTAVVAVVERVRHAKYAKFVNRTKKLYAHDATERRQRRRPRPRGADPPDEQDQALAHRGSAGAVRNF